MKGVKQKVDKTLKMIKDFMRIFFSDSRKENQQLKFMDDNRWGILMNRKLKINKG